ncbi:FG-GAP-like repeat-containing protein [Nonomuraea sp. NPDC050202]|uniref:FG-GAP-like repeat-containing protein n=1 Tax=Nonomuraea sp. NPDC050202 TaxID=3155035 RepID=UPI0033F671B5
MTLRAALTALAALAVMAGTATASVTPASAAVPPASAVTPATAAACSGAADFDGDGVDDVAVGDPFADDQKGAVHVLSGGKVVPVGVPGLARGDGFGWSVRLAQVNGDACADLVIGAPYADVDGTEDAGAAYVVYGGGSAAPERLTAPQPQRFAHFGWSMAARGDLVAIGAPYEDEARLLDVGAVYVRKGAGELRRVSQETVDVRGNSEVGDQFGWSMAFGPENGLVVGVPYENDDGAGRQIEAGKIDSGSVVFIDDVLAPRITSFKLDSPTNASGDRFGYAVVYAEGSGYAVGSPGPGYVQLLDPARKPTRRVTQGGKQAFGFSMAVSADGRLAIGAPYGGGVRVVSWKDAAEVRELATADGLFGWSVAFSGNKLYVGQPDAAPYGKVAVAARNDEAAPQPVQPPKGADFGVSLAG